MTSLKSTVDNSEVDARLIALQKAAKSQPEALSLSGRVLANYVRDTFREETDPWGAPWPKLQPATLDARRKKGNYRVSILIDSAAMFDSIRDESDGVSATVSVGAGLAYPPTQQFGDSDQNIPARAFMPLRSFDDAQIPDDWVANVLAPIEKAIADSLV